MKAILVLNDMPESCIECPCEYDELYCQESEHQLSYDELFDHRPENCPLKQMPKRKTMADVCDPHFSEDEIMMLRIYRGGWNDCIDAIGGEDGEDDIDT